MKQNLSGDMNSWANKAMQAMQNRDFATAVAFFDKLGKFARSNEQLAKAAGFAHLQLGNDNRALVFLTASLKSRVAQADVNAAVGDIYVRRGDQEKSIKHLRRAAALVPQAAELRYKLGLALIGFDRFEEAILEMQAALEMNPRYLQAKLGLARALTELNKFDEAETAFQEATALDPKNYAVSFRKAKLREKQQRYDEAIALYKESEAGSDHAAPVCEALALAELSNGETEAALATLRRGLQKSPLNDDLLKHVADLRYEMGDPEAFSHYSDALDTRPVPTVHADYVARLVLAGQHDEAKLQLTHYETRFGRDPRCLGLKVQLLYEQERFEEITRTLAQAPIDDLDLMTWKARALLACGDAVASQNLLLELLKTTPYDQYLLALLSTCYRLSDNPAYHELVNYDSLLIRSELAVPPGFGNLVSFNEALRETLEELHVMRTQPLSQSVIGGTQTPGNLLNNPNPVIVALKQAIHTTLKREFGPSFYENIDTNHPVSVGNGHSMSLPTAWSIWVTAGGYHRSHVHPRGWYSSAYYVSLPGKLQATGRTETDGNLAFGRPGVATPGMLEADRTIAPAEGILALFPSYFWHETLPFKGDEARVVVAFDAVPSG